MPQIPSDFFQSVRPNRKRRMRTQELQGPPEHQWPVQRGPRPPQPAGFADGSSKALRVELLTPGHGDGKKAARKRRASQSALLLWKEENRQKSIDERQPLISIHR